MSDTQNRPILKLPLIGKIGEIECLSQLGNIVEIPDIQNRYETHHLIQRFQRALGDYLWDSGEYKFIIKLLFPGTEEINVKPISNITIETLTGSENFPLFARLFIRAGQIEDSVIKEEKKRQLSSAWSSLMLELGEFYLDERFNNLEKDIKENLLRNLCVKSGAKEHNVLYALFDSHDKMVEEIWNRILGDDIFLIFVDDNPAFADKWGLKEFRENGKQNNSKQDGGFTRLRKSKENMTWLNPLKINNGENKSYNHLDTKKKIIDKIQLYLKKRPEALPVLVVDLLIKDKGDINRIKGDNLITELRNELNTNALIIGFTGGKSPFVINSAVKAGADIVIMKERGETIDIPNSHGSGNPGGLFDLLWALSQNISKWRFLEKYKEFAENKFSEDKRFYRPVLEQLFFSIENESPFWRKYLTDWQKEMENLRLKSIMKSYSHE